MCRENNIQKKIKCVLASLAWLSRVSFGFHGFAYLCAFMHQALEVSSCRKYFIISRKLGLADDSILGCCVMSCHVMICLAFS